MIGQITQALAQHVRAHSRQTAEQVVEAFGAEQEVGGFGETAEGGWAGGYFNDEAVADSVEQLSGCDTFLCGRVTYELLSRAWAGSTGEYPEMINRIPKLVASTTLSGELPWNAAVIDGDVVGQLAALKQEPGEDIIMYGSPTLMHSMAVHDLIEAYKVSICPITLGRGIRLFPEGLPRNTFDLTNVKPLSTGVVILTYERAGLRDLAD